MILTPKLDQEISNIHAHSWDVCNKIIFYLQNSPLIGDIDYNNDIIYEKPKINL